MTQVGTIEYRAVVTGAEDAQGDADEVTSSFTQMGEQAEATAGSAGFLGGVLSTTSGDMEDTTNQADDADTSFTLLTGTTWVLSKALQAMGVSVGGAGAAGALGTLVGGAKSAVRWLGGALVGALGTVSGYLSSFVGWLAAGSAGALAVAGAIGAVIGLFGVWILEITGVLDWLGRLGSTLRSSLPGWAADGITAVIGLFAGPLAVIGGFIIGFIEGGFDQGFKRAGEVIDIFFGAFKRQIDRASAWVYSLADDAAAAFAGIADTVAGSVSTAWNSTVPSSVSVPSITIGGGEFMGNDVPSKTFGGGSINLPQLQTGGMIEQAGIAQVHQGEAVIPSPIVDAAESGGGGGGGGDTTVEVSSINIDVSGEFDPSDVSRRDLDSLASRLVDLIGDKTNRRAGVR
jgi:hypothetical protein